MKTITHAQLVEATDPDPIPLMVSADVGRADTGIVLVFGNGAERIYYPESVKVRQGLDQIKIIGTSRVRFVGIGPDARIARVIDPPALETVPDPVEYDRSPDPEPDPVPEPKATARPRRSRSRSWVRWVLGWLPGRRRPQRRPEGVEASETRREGANWASGTDMDGMLTALLMAAEVADEFEAIYGRPLTEHDRKLGITLYLTEQRKRGNHER